jgi:hypothetical protein
MSSKKSIKMFLNELKEFGISEQDFSVRKKELFLKTGIENNDNDVIWSLFNELLVLNSNDFDIQSKIYLSMAIFLFNEGKDFFPLLKESYRAELLSLELKSIESPLTSMAIIVTSTNEKSGACSKCKELNGFQMTFEDALEKMPIPIKNCDRSVRFNRCTSFYHIQFLRNEDGMLIDKNKND